MTEQARIEIWHGLRNYYGAIQDVVEATQDLHKGGYSRSYVEKVLAGQRQNIDILNLAADVLKRRKDEHAEKVRRLHNMARQLAISV